MAPTIYLKLQLVKVSPPLYKMIHRRSVAPVNESLCWGWHALQFFHRKKRADVSPTQGKFRRVFLLEITNFLRSIKVKIQFSRKVS